MSCGPVGLPVARDVASAGLADDRPVAVDDLTADDGMDRPAGHVDPFEGAVVLPRLAQLGGYRLRLVEVDHGQVGVESDVE